MTPAEREEIEHHLFLEALRLGYGYDFSHYAQASLKRRLQNLARLQGCTGLLELIPRLLQEPLFLPEVVARISVPVTEMFRHPPTYQVIRDKVTAVLASYPRIKVWQAGCATGEEVYSLAILLHEEGLLEQSTLFATDINDEAIARAEEGVFPVQKLQDYSRNYQAAGGKGSLLDYFHVRYDFAKVDDRLKRNIVFAHHNLVSDGVFAETHFIHCANVLIYFDRLLQERVLTLFRESLVRGGFLCLGHRENLHSSASANYFRVIDGANRIFQSRPGG